MRNLHDNFRGGMDIIMIKDRKLLFMIFTIACFIAVGVCYIVDNAINKQVTWSAYPLLSILFGWLSISPVFIKKHGIISSLCASTLLVIPYIYFIEKITPVNNWFIPLGLPSAITGIITIWVIYLLFRFLKISIWYKEAISILLAGVIASPIINYYVDAFLNEKTSSLNLFINIFSCAVTSAVLGIIGYIKGRGKSSDNN